ncbi:hypothetical protein OSTOST_19032 [Ostertagia ostertagi]
MGSNDAAAAAFRVFSSGLGCLTERFPWTQKGLEMGIGELKQCDEVDWSVAFDTVQRYVEADNAPSLSNSSTQPQHTIEIVMSDENPPLWESVLKLDWMAILEWIYDHLPFEVKSYIWMIILTLLFVITLCGCCCMICFCSPCCACAIWYRKRQSRRNRGGLEFSTYPSAPPLLSKI